MYLEHIDNTGNVQSQVESSGVTDENESGIWENLEPLGEQGGQGNTEMGYDWGLDEELEPVEPIEPECWEAGEHKATDSDDSDFYDSDYDLEEDDILFEMNVDPGVEDVGGEDKGKGKRISGEGVEGGYVTEDVYARMQFEEGDEDCAGSGDELYSLCGSDEEPQMKFPKFYPRSEIKNALWAAARAIRIEELGRRIEELKEIDELAYDWLVKNPPKQWSRSHFNPFPKCDILLNNMCECFNALILDARGKHIIPMFESIRTILMLMMQLNREKAGNWESVICAKIRDLLVKNMKQAGECIPMRSDEWNFKIKGPFDQHTFNVLDMICSCRRWELTSIPCSHAISAIWCRNENLEIYVHKVYTIDAYKQCYEKAIPSVNGPELWHISQLEPLLPPKYKEVVDLGRPQRLRRIELDEPPPGILQTKLRGVPRRKNKCKMCGGMGHNSKGCRTKKMNEQQNEQGQGQGNAQTQENTTDVGQGQDNATTMPHDPLAAEASTASQSINSQDLAKRRQKLHAQIKM
ncbi:hypothetical protein BUALT_Bualt05G0033800 [Buddleja alternifolia]|uniref:SWIM-type domain-containing protein n=1 Tax=Buddleja alternifolia TaxID=168488 RepID=A0AAV6XSE2_9LAMI|nr:hypothetical protein BUALT_Bualt05G0033800 [Buddleja alternifolia]